MIKAENYIFNLNSEIILGDEFFFGVEQTFGLGIAKKS